MFIVKSIEETMKLLQTHCQNYPLKTVTLPLEEARNRITAEDIPSTMEIPHFHRSTVDGYAVTHKAVAFAGAQSPVPLRLIGEVEMGKPSHHKLDDQTTVYTPTGAHLPENATAVVMIENADTLGPDILINKKVAKWENVLMKGSDIQKGDMVVQKHQKLTPMRIGALKAAGVDSVTVYKKPTALVLSTGDEITDEAPLEIGEILDINTHTVKHYLEDKNIDVVKTKVVKDDFDAYKQAVLEGMKHYDLVVASGGSSVGEQDHTYHVLQEIGADIFVHGVNIKPGKPTVFAKQENRLFIGLPGHPTSAYMVLQTFFPTIYNTIHAVKEPLIRPYVEGRLTQNVASAQGRTTYQLVKIEPEVPLKVVPIHAKSGMIASLKESYGYIILHAGDEGSQQGDIVRVYKLGDL